MEEMEDEKTIAAFLFHGDPPKHESLAIAWLATHL